LFGLVGFGGMLGTPAVAFAGHGAAAPSVAMYTLWGLAAVMIIAALVSVGLSMAHRMRFIGGDQRVILGRRIRVGFGAAFLMAVVSPYVALHFSVATLIPFVAAGGLVVSVWVWGATRRELESAADGV
jgi:hypothetical protein